MNTIDTNPGHEESVVTSQVEVGSAIRRRLFHAALVGSVVLGGSAAAATNEDVRHFAFEVVTDIQHGVDAARVGLAHMMGAPLFEPVGAYHDEG